MAAFRREKPATLTFFVGRGGYWPVDPSETKKLAASRAAFLRGLLLSHWSAPLQKRFDVFG
jgi:hypothetical protein